MADMVINPAFPDRLVDVFFPFDYTCSGCGSMRHMRQGSYFCPDCKAAFSRLDILAYCPLCQQLRSQCTCSSTLLSCAHAAFRYEDNIEEMIKRYKYGRVRALAPAFAELLLPAVRQIAQEADVIAPVPLHPKRERWRGFNQATLLAQLLASSLQIPCLDKALTRIRNTPTQTRFTRSERIKNMQGAFAPGRQSVYAHSVLLIDDVLTTGATLESCAEVLLQSGALEVHALTIAAAAFPKLV